jgi:hypothetical protein
LERSLKNFLPLAAQSGEVYAQQVTYTLTAQVTGASKLTLKRKSGSNPVA